MAKGRNAGSIPSSCTQNKSRAVTEEYWLSRKTQLVRRGKPAAGNDRAGTVVSVSLPEMSANESSQPLGGWLPYNLTSPLRWRASLDHLGIVITKYPLNALGLR